MSLKMKRKFKNKVLKSPYFNSKKVDLTSGDIHNYSSSSTSIKVDKSKRLLSSFFDVPCVELAKELLGKVLVHVSPNGGMILKGRIVETESYLGGEDKASISYGGKVTEKSKPMYMSPGTTFVYLTYGMYNLINISSRGDGAAVLIRALEPIEGIEQMLKNRNEFQPNKNKPKKESKYIPDHQLCNGPAKLCISLGITKDECNMKDLTTWTNMWVESGDSVAEEQIVNSRRVGIDSAGPEWANKLLRFYVVNNKCVSKRDKTQEALLLNKHFLNPS